MEEYQLYVNAVSISGVFLLLPAWVLAIGENYMSAFALSLVGSGAMAYSFITVLEERPEASGWFFWATAAEILFALTCLIAGTLPQRPQVHRSSPPPTAFRTTPPNAGANTSTIGHTLVDYRVPPHATIASHRR